MPPRIGEANIPAWKKQARTRLLAVRDALGNDAREKISAAITDRLIALTEFETAGTIAAYSSFGSEFDTAAFINAALAGGKRVLLPRVDRTRQALAFHAATDLDSLLPGAWGIREPDPLRCPTVDLQEVDFMLVPGLAFTTRCERLGYGGGFYDAAIDTLQPGVTKVAAVFATQIVDTLVVERHDRSVDMVVTESAAYSSGIDLIGPANT